jgi:hypothetical protein
MSGDVRDRLLPDEDLGRICFLGFAEGMQEHMPGSANWDGLSDRVKKGWIAAAKKVRSVSV